MIVLKGVNLQKGKSSSYSYSLEIKYASESNIFVDYLTWN